MKKSFLAVLLVLVFAACSFAETFEVVGKLGLGGNSKIENDGNSQDVNSPVIIGAEGYVYALPSLGLGVGISNVFDADMQDSDVSIGFTNVYFSVKPKVGFIANVYLLGQIGYGFTRVSKVYEKESGMYWGIGAGIEVTSFVFELVYSNNKFSVTPEEIVGSIDVTHSMIALNAGYKFSI